MDGACEVQVTFSVAHGGILSFCDDYKGMAVCNDSLSFTSADTSAAVGEIVTPSDPFYGDLSTFTVSGPASAVASALANFSFCPSCISTDYDISMSITSMNESACIVNDAESWNFTIRAATNLNMVIVGSVVDGLCANSDTSTACWDGTSAVESAVITGELTCSSISTTAERYVRLPCFVVITQLSPQFSCVENSDGSYALSLPYSASEHGTSFNLTISADGFQSSSDLYVTLGASSLTSDSSRYQWVSANLTDTVTGGGYCEDMTARTYVDSTYCAVTRQTTLNTYHYLFNLVLSGGRG